MVGFWSSRGSRVLVLLLGAPGATCLKLSRSGEAQPSVLPTWCSTLCEQQRQAESLRLSRARDEARSQAAAAVSDALAEVRSRLRQHGGRLAAEVEAATSSAQHDAEEAANKTVLEATRMGEPLSTFGVAGSPQDLIAAEGYRSARDVVSARLAVEGPQIAGLSRRAKDSFLQADRTWAGTAGQLRGVASAALEQWQQSHALLTGTLRRWANVRTTLGAVGRDLSAAEANARYADALAGSALEITEAAAAAAHGAHVTALSIKDSEAEATRMLSANGEALVRLKALLAHIQTSIAK